MRAKTVFVHLGGYKMLLLDSFFFSFWMKVSLMEWVWNRFRRNGNVPQSSSKLL